jgi:hypothetical protein
MPNWLDTAGYASGAIQGRWFDASSAPTPQIRKLKLDAVRAALPVDTPIVSTAQRDVALRARRLAAQLRTIW